MTGLILVGTVVVIVAVLLVTYILTRRKYWYAP